MVKKFCAVLNCQSTSEDKNLSFYDIKKRSAVYKPYWLEILDPIKGADDGGARFMCSQHFITADFINPSCKNRGLRQHAIPSRKIPCIRKEIDAREIEVCAYEKVDCAILKEEPCAVSHDETLNESLKVIKEPVALRDHDYVFTHEHSEQMHAKMQKLLENNKVLRKKIRAVVRKQKSVNKRANKWKNRLIKLKKNRKKVPFNGGGFLNELSRNSSRSPRGSRYSEETKKIALGLYYCSARAYSELQKHLRLPSISLIQKWLRNIQISEGISKNVMNLLKEKAKLLPLKDRVVVISIDEMSLKPNLSYLGKAKPDVIMGFPTKLPGKTLQISNRAASVLVVMIRLLNSGCKHSIGYFFSGTGFKADDLLTIFQQSVQEIVDAGYLPKALVCDQNATNRCLFSKLGITQEHPSCEVYGQKIYGFYDPPHLLKSSRNNLIHHNGIYDGNVIKWDHIRQLYDQDSTRLPRAVPKLSIEHVFLPAFGEMRVAVAAQTLSASVAAAFNTYVAMDILPAECNFTAKYCADIDKLFDIFNSSSSATKDNKPLTRPLTSGSDHWKVMSQLEEKLKTLRFIDKECDSVETENNYKKLPKQSRLPWYIDGWLSNLNGLRLLWAELAEHYEFNQLETRNLNQDIIENFFGVIRMKNLNNNRPDPSQFRSAYRATVANQMLKASEKSNCDDDASINVLSLVDYARLKLFTTDVPEINVHEFIPDDPNDIEDQDMLQVNIMNYTAGWITKKIKHEACLLKLRSDESPPQQHYAFCKAKSVATEIRSSQLERILNEVASHFRRFFEKYLETSNVGVKQRMMDYLLKTTKIDILCTGCKKAIYDKFLNILIKGKLKELNGKLIKTRSTTKKRKTAQSEKAKKLNI